MTISPTLDAPSSWYKRRSIHTNYCRLEAMPTLASSSHLLAILAVALLVTSGDPVSAGYIGSPPRSRPTAAFIFGDSLVDTGTNNRLPSTISKADHHPYGIDFPGGQPPGRYCNGRLVSDFAGTWYICCVRNPSLFRINPATIKDELGVHNVRLFKYIFGAMGQ